jgi:hypothetical protein
VALLTEKLCILHIPKTAGRFIERVLPLVGVPVTQVGDINPFPSLLGQEYPWPWVTRQHSVPTPEQVGNRIVVAFVRHPVDWLRSYHGHVGTGKGETQGRFDARRTKAASFDDFAFDVAENDPGYVGSMFNAYLSGWSTLLTFSLGDVNAGLATALDAGGEAYDSFALAASPPFGEGTKPLIGEDAFNAVCASEARFLERYGYTSNYRSWESFAC